MVASTTMTGGARFCHDHRLACPICDAPPLHNAFAKTSAALPAPYRNPTGGDTWYHGTAYQFEPEEDEGHQGEDDPGGRVRAPDRFASEYGENASHHWNTDLGVHFTSLPQVARAFATGGASSGAYERSATLHSRVLHAGLHMANPAHFADEGEMAKAAIGWAHSKGMHFLPSTGDKSEDRAVHRHFVNGDFDQMEHPEHDYEYLDHAPEHDRRARLTISRISQRGPEGRSLTSVENYLRLHPMREEITDGWRDHLQNQGHDGITYGNSHEGPEGHTCAIAFPDTVVHHRRWQWMHEDRQHLNTEQGHGYGGQRSQVHPGQDELPLKWSALAKAAAGTTLHRGISVQVSGQDLAEAHERGGMDAVHQHIVDAVAAHKPGLGTHWTSDLAVARKFAGGIHGSLSNQTPKTVVDAYSDVHVPVVLHGKVHPTHHETDPDELAWHAVQGYGWNPSATHPITEAETLVRSGAPVTLTHVEACLPTAPNWVHQVRRSLDSFGESGDLDGHAHAWRQVGGPAQHTAGIVPIKAYHSTRHAVWPMKESEGWHHLGTPEAALRRAVDSDYGCGEDDAEAIRYGHPSQHRWYVHEVELHGRVYPHVLDDETANHLAEDTGETYERRPDGSWGTVSHSGPDAFKDLDQDYHQNELGMPVHPHGYTIFPYRNAHEDQGSISYLAHSSAIKPVQVHDLGQAYVHTAALRTLAFAYQGQAYSPHEYTHTHPWLPSTKMFAPGKSTLDPRLFDGDTLKTQVRDWVLARIGRIWYPEYHGWQDWARIYLAGSEATYWWGNGQHGDFVNNDLDILIGIDYAAFKAANPDFADLDPAAIDLRLNTEFRAQYNDEDATVPWEPYGNPWHVTAFVNPGSWDIRDIKPYGAYEILTGTWYVRPPEVPKDWGPQYFDESTWAYCEATLALVNSVRALPEPDRTRRGAMLYDAIHSDRTNAFSVHGSGWTDPANVVMKYLDTEPSKPFQFLVECKHRLNEGLDLTEPKTASVVDDLGSRPEYDSTLDYDGNRARQRAWTSGVRSALSRGHMSVEQAQAAGYRGMGHDDSSHGLRWQALPQTLYHVTTDADSVRAHGLKSREQLAQHAGKGLGGGESDTISFTTDEPLAHHIQDSLHEFHDVLNGRKTAADLIEEARTGTGAAHPFLKEMVGSYGDTDWHEGKDFPHGLQAVLDGKVTKWRATHLGQADMEIQHGSGWTPHPASVAIHTKDGPVHTFWHRDATPEEQRENLANLYKHHSAWREYAGGKPDPLFFATDVHGFAKMDPKKFAVLKFHPHPGAQGYPLEGMGEWRTTDGRAVHLAEPSALRLVEDLGRHPKWADRSSREVHLMDPQAAQQAHARELERHLIEHHEDLVGRPNADILHRAAHQQAGDAAFGTHTGPRQDSLLAHEHHPLVDPARSRRDRLNAVAGMYGPPWYVDAPEEQIDDHTAAEQIRQSMDEHTSDQGHRYRLTHDGGTTYATYLGKASRPVAKPQIVGTLSTLSNWYGPGRHSIYKAFVKPAHRRRGLASAMLTHARSQMEGTIEHSTALSEDGKAWAEKFASASGSIEEFFRTAASGGSIEVAGIAVKAEDTGRVLLLQRSNADESDPARGTWEFPGGHLEEGEDPFAGARREWCEETGASFPEGAPVVANWISGGMYQGFVVMIPTEADLDINLDHEDRDVLNPDDPDGDDMEVAAWWEVEHMKGNPAIRSEVRKGTDWAAIQDAKMPGSTKTKQAQKFAALLKAAEEDYRGHHQAPDADYGAPMHDPSSMLPDVHEHPEYYTSPHQTGTYQSWHALRSVKDKPDKTVMVYRAVPHGAKHINPGDWVTPSREYALLHASSQSCPGCGKNMQVLKARVKARHLHTEGDINEWGYTGPEPVQTWGSYRMSCPKPKEQQ